MRPIQRIPQQDLDELLISGRQDVRDVSGTGQLSAEEHLEIVTRLQQLAYREQTKALVMFWAVQNSTNTVGFWSSD